MEKQTESVSIWTIAGGILLALVIWRAYNVWQYNRAVEQVNAMMVQSMEESKRSTAAARQQFIERQQRQQAAASQRKYEVEAAMTLRPDERCINKQRFRRVANGWEQVGSC